MLDANQINGLFLPDNAGQGDGWIGEVSFSPDRTEYVPFRYLSYRFVVTFTHPGQYFGLNDEEVQEVAPDMIKNGVIPDISSRLIKFYRAEADHSDPVGAYNPKMWPLASKRQVFQFGDILRTAICQHSLTLPQTTEYYYMATNTKLETFYGRIFGKTDVDDNFCLFEPILGSPGELYGYRKKANV